MFQCKMCGRCCRNLDKSDLYNFLNRGDGVCKFLRDNECSIYDERPIICRVDDSYEMFFKDKLSIDEYYQLNYEGCIAIKKESK